MNLSDMLLVVAPNQFPQRHKTPSSNTFSFSTTTQVSPSCRMTYTSSNNSNLEETETSNIINDMIIDENVAEDNSSKIPHEASSYVTTENGETTKALRKNQIDTTKVVINRKNNIPIPMEYSSEEKVNIRYNNKINTDEVPYQRMSSQSWVPSKENENQLLTTTVNQQDTDKIGKLVKTVTSDNEMQKDRDNDIPSSSQYADGAYESTETDSKRHSKPIKPLPSEDKEKIDISTIVSSPKRMLLTQEQLKETPMKDVLVQKKRTGIRSIFNSGCTSGIWLIWSVVMLCGLCIFSYLIYDETAFPSQKRCATSWLRMKWQKGPPPI